MSPPVSDAFDSNELPEKAIFVPSLTMQMSWRISFGRWRDWAGRYLEKPVWCFVEAGILGQPTLLVEWTPFHRTIGGWV
jgi:hypothetical protein